MSRDHLGQASGLTKALLLMGDALAILDEHGAPGEIGAHLDHAIAKLEGELGVEGRTPETLEALIAAL